MVHNASSDRLEMDIQTIQNQHVRVKCEKCGASIRTDRLAKHMKKVHNVSPAGPVTHLHPKQKKPWYLHKCVEISSSVKTDKPDKSIKYLHRVVLEIPIAKNPKPPHQVQKPKM
jgi:hypothetical protein